MIGRLKVDVTTTSNGDLEPLATVICWLPNKAVYDDEVSYDQ